MQCLSNCYIDWVYVQYMQLLHQWLLQPVFHPSIHQKLHLSLLPPFFNLSLNNESIIKSFNHSSFNRCSIHRSIRRSICHSFHWYIYDRCSVSHSFNWCSICDSFNQCSIRRSWSTSQRHPVYHHTLYLLSHPSWSSVHHHCRYFHHHNPLLPLPSTLSTITMIKILVMIIIQIFLIIRIIVQVILVISQYQILNLTCLTSTMHGITSLPPLWIFATITTTGNVIITISALLLGITALK